MSQRYLIIPHEGEPFNTKWFEAENHYQEGMIVFDLACGDYTEDGINWKPIQVDHL